MSTLYTFVHEQDDNEILYIGRLNGSGFFFVGTKAEFEEDVKFLGKNGGVLDDTLVLRAYRKTLVPDEPGIVVLVKNGSAGKYWFRSEYQKMREKRCG